MPPLCLCGSIDLERHMFLYFRLLNILQNFFFRHEGLVVQLAVLCKGHGRKNWKYCAVQRDIPNQMIWSSDYIHEPDHWTSVENTQFPRKPFLQFVFNGQSYRLESVGMDFIWYLTKLDLGLADPEHWGMNSSLVRLSLPSAAPIVAGSSYSGAPGLEIFFKMARNSNHSDLTFLTCFL